MSTTPRQDRPMCSLCFI